MSLGSQYLTLSSLLAYKTQSSLKHTDKIGKVDFSADVSRAYCPGDWVTANISLPAELLEKYVCLTVQLKCEVHTYYIQSNGQTTSTVHRHEDVFDHFCELTGRRSEPHEVWPETARVQATQVTSPDDSTRAWQVNFRLPHQVVRVMVGKEQVTTGLPSMFIDRPHNEINGQSNSALYCLKLKGINKGLFSSDLKMYVPLLVVPFSPTAGHAPKLPLPQAPETGLDFGPSFTTFKSRQTITKALVLDKGAIEVKISFPHLRNIPSDTGVPFFLEITAYGGSPEDLEPGGAARLPSLPLTGAGEHQPVFTLERKVVGIGSKNVKGWTGAKNHHKDKLPVRVEWSPHPASAIPPNERTAPFTQYGCDWTPARRTEASARKSERFCRSARVVGLVSADVCPTIEYPKLMVHYRLLFRWPVQGATNDVECELGEWNAGTGITEEMAGAVDRVELARSILTRRAPAPIATESASSSSGPAPVPPPPYPSDGKDADVKGAGGKGWQ